MVNRLNRRRWIIRVGGFFILVLVFYAHRRMQIIRGDVLKSPRNEVFPEEQAPVFVAAEVTGPTGQISAGSSLDSFATAPCGQVCDYNLHRKEGETYLKKDFNCLALFRRMKHPPGKVYDPPLRKPPPELVEAFTQNGELDLEFWYWNFKNYHHVTLFNKTFIDTLIKNDKNKKMIGAYGHESAGLKELLQKYAAELNGKSGIVIGTQHPWVEVMLLNVGVNHVTTVDYNTITIEHPNISVISVTNLAEKNLDGRFQPADFAVSFSSIEHAGLGRYGDPLNPYGDLESAAQTWCMLKPGGLFFLGVPANFGKRKGKIRFNGDRIYGEARLEHLTANFLELERRPFEYDSIITLRKPLSV